MAQEQGRQMRLTKEELAIISGLFKDNEAALKVMRKIFLPEYDPNAPIGQIVDLWQTVPIDEMTDEKLVATFRARNDLIKHVEARLQELNILAHMDEEKPSEKSERLAKNSSK